MNIFLDLFLTFLKIGAFTFGGGYAMLPFVRDEVAAHGWMTDAALLDFVAVSESTPGPFAINIVTYVGSEMGGIFGAFCATLGVVLPSFCIILIVARCYAAFRESRAVKGCMSGLKPAAIGLIASAVFSMAGTVFMPTGWNLAVFTDPNFYVSAAIFAVSLLLVFKKKTHPILIVCLSACVGIAAGYLLPLLG